MVKWVAEGGLKTASPEGEAQRQEFVRRFPWQSIPGLTLDQYALGTGNENSFSSWLEHKTQKLGRWGGDSLKHGVFRRKDGVWRYPKPFADENAAFDSIRTGLYELAQAASEERYEDLDRIGERYLGGKQGLRFKPLYLWFPDRFVPITSYPHLEHFLRALDMDVPASVTARNRALTNLVQSEFASQGWDTRGFVHFLYHAFPPPKESKFGSLVDDDTEDSPESDVLLALLRREKNVVLTGPPGTGKTWWAQRAVRLVGGRAGASHPAATGAASRIEFVTFHPSFGYEEFVEGIRPAMDEEGEGALRYEVRRGPFLRLADAARAAWEQDGEDAPDFLLVVDEINRADVARTFGDLLALLEPSKRLDRPDALEATLPYSGRRLGLPPNLLLLATMNTSDRSVAAMDLALRRRFAFVECGPEPDLLGEVAGVDLARLLRALNEGIGALLGADLALGHAFLMDAADAASLEAAWRGRILPQMSETFHGRTGELEALLGPDFFEDVPLPARLQGRFDAPPRRMRDLRGEALLAALRGLYQESSVAGFPDPSPLPLSPGEERGSS